MTRSLSFCARPRDRPWTYDETWDVACKTTNALHRLGLDCCLFGGMGARLHGNPRGPNDIDIIVLNAPDDDAEELKRRLETIEPQRFYRRRSRNPAAKYQVLWYKIDEDHSCKVDLLTPGGDLRIPVIPRERIEWRAFLPVAPFSVVFLLKLQGWSDHRASLEEHKRLKQYLDHEDVEHMLDIALENDSRPLEDPIHRPTRVCDRPVRFCGKARRRMLAYAEDYPESRWKWEKIGFRPIGPDRSLRKEKAVASLYSFTTPSRLMQSGCPSVKQRVVEAGCQWIFGSIDSEIWDQL